MLLIIYMQVWLSSITTELTTRFLFTLPRASSITNTTAIDRETCKLGMIISITAPHTTLTWYALLRCHPAACLSSCFIIHQSFAMRINSITFIWFALYLSLLLLRCIAWTGYPAGTSRQIYRWITFTSKRMLLLWFQLSVFDFCFLHSIWSCQGSGAKANHQNLDSDFRLLAREIYPYTYKPKIRG